jgi:hypothetical protein
LSLLSLPRAGSRSRRLVVCGAAAAVVLLPATAQAETLAPAPAAESSAVTTTGSPAPAAEAPAEPSADQSSADTTATDGSVTDETATAGTTTDDAATDEGSTENTTTDEGSTDDDATDEGSTDDTTTDEGSVEETPTDEGSGEELPAFPEIDPAALTGLFVPTCDNGTLTTLTLQLDQLRGLLQELQDGGFPVPDEAFAELPDGTIDIPVDDTTLGELATELNTLGAELGDLGLTDADIEASLAELPAGIRADVETLLGELQTGTVQPATLRALLMEVFPCPVEAPVAPVGQDVDYLGYAPTGGNGSTGGSPLALLGAGAALLAGGGLFTASAIRSRAARA